MVGLALDLGTKTGFALCVGRGVVVSGMWDLRPAKYEGGGLRYVKFETQLDNLHRNTPVDIVWFEAVRRHLGTDAAHVYGGLMATLQKWCEVRRVPYEGVPVGTIKKFWTGKGNATKEAMIAEAVRRGFEVDDDNEADAVALLLLKCREAEGERPSAEAKAKSAA